MVSSGPNTNSSRFVLTCDKTDWVDGKHIVFGEVTEGLDVLQQIEMGAHLGPGCVALWESWREGPWQIPGRAASAQAEVGRWGGYP